jgi:hypothetical protein
MNENDNIKNFANKILSRRKYTFILPEEKKEKDFKSIIYTFNS